MMDWLNRLAQCTRGASAAEYALILAIIGAGIAAAAFFLGAEVATAINDAGSCISTEGSACP
jgi:pilus assembly protein Flp/PilA